MTTHSSILAGIIPWTEEPDGLQSMGVAKSRTERLNKNNIVCVCSIAQSCLTLCDPMDCNPPGSSVLGIISARILEWVVISFSRGSSRPRD